MPHPEEDKYLALTNYFDFAIKPDKYRASPVSPNWTIAFQQAVPEIKDFPNVVHAGGLFLQKCYETERFSFIEILRRLTPSKKLTEINLRIVETSDERALDQAKLTYGELAERDIGNYLSYLTQVIGPQIPIYFYFNSPSLDYLGRPIFETQTPNIPIFGYQVSLAHPSRN